MLSFMRLFQFCWRILIIILLLFALLHRFFSMVIYNLLSEIFMWVCLFYIFNIFSILGSRLLMLINQIRSLSNGITLIYLADFLYRPWFIAMLTSIAYFSYFWEIADPLTFCEMIRVFFCRITVYCSVTVPEIDLLVIQLIGFLVFVFTYSMLFGAIIGWLWVTFAFAEGSVYFLNCCLLIRAQGHCLPIKNASYINFLIVL